MTNEEKLRVYAAYLPYQLKTQYNNGDIVTIIGVNTETLQVNSEFTHYGYSDTRIDDVKPVLYPLEYLTKEIEHERKRFVPIDFFEEIFNTDVEMDSEDTFLIGPKGKGEELLGIEDLPYLVVQKLLSWHFNVFNLSEAEYINKATLTNK